MRSPRAVLGLLLLAVSLSGCASAKMEVRARNLTDSPVVVHVWINHTAEPSWHRWTAVPPRGEASLGVFGGPAHNDYSMAAVAGALHVARSPQQLGNSYPSWRLDVLDGEIQDFLSVY